MGKGGSANEQTLSTTREYRGNTFFRREKKEPGESDWKNKKSACEEFGGRDISTCKERGSQKQAWKAQGSYC